MNIAQRVCTVALSLCAAVASAGEVVLEASGPFGYTVRVVPTHAGLPSVADLGLVANA